MIPREAITKYKVTIDLCEGCASVVFHVQNTAAVASLNVKIGGRQPPFTSSAGPQAILSLPNFIHMRAPGVMLTVVGAVGRAVFVSPGKVVSTNMRWAGGHVKGVIFAVLRPVDKAEPDGVAPSTSN